MQDTQSRRQLRNRRVKRRRRRIVVSALSAFLLLGGGMEAYHQLTRPLSQPSNRAYATVHRIVIPKPPEERNRTTILLIGTDTRPGDANGNSDVLMLCSIDNKNKRMEVMSIPRDTKVRLPSGESAKINKGLQTGGPTLTVNLVESLTGIPIDYYVLTHFGGLVKVINTIGGISVNVPERMLYNTGDRQYGTINLKPGLQTLNGEQALGFVRFRHDALGDIGRTERQQQFVTAFVHQLLQPENIGKLPDLITGLNDAVETDLSVMKLGELASSGTKYRDYKVIHETLPGSFHDPIAPTDQSYWIVNPDQAKYSSAQFFYHGSVVKNPIQDESYTVNWTEETAQQPTTSTPMHSATKAPSTMSVQNTAKVRNGSAVLRTGPGDDYSTVAKLFEGDEVTLLKQVGMWYEVENEEGITGFVRVESLILS